MIKLKHRPQCETSGALKQSSKQKVCFSIHYCDLYALPRIDNLETNQNNISILLGGISMFHWLVIYPPTSGWFLAGYIESQPCMTEAFWAKRCK